MSKAEFINEYQHRIFGLVVDGSHNRHRAGAELSLWLVDSMRKVREELGAMYDDFHPQTVAVNGKKEPTTISKG